MCSAEITADTLSLVSAWPAGQVVILLVVQLHHSSQPGQVVDLLSDQLDHFSSAVSGSKRCLPDLLLPASPVFTLEILSLGSGGSGTPAPLALSICTKSVYFWDTKTHF